MCRFIAYKGKPTVMAEVLLRSDNSLLNQSLSAKESDVPTNGDGFGIAWYSNLSKKAGLFTAITPAWNNRNLRHLAEHIKSACFFAHVRAASAGGVTEYNCHPFVHQNHTFMHNGSIGGFYHIKRRLRSMLDDELYHVVKGETDSEHIFALYLQNLKNGYVMFDAFKKTIEQLHELDAKYNYDKETSYLNICITNGEEIAASRLTSGPEDEALTLHVMQDEDGMKNQEIIVASEVLTANAEKWQAVNANHFLFIDKDLKINQSV